ncbi:MAG: hypothetical protein JO318_09640, partial [Chloroflexi bacterium]|nr:hypothetical protein [Chloroflexota bacterium]
HQPVGVYAANVAAQGLPLPEGWAEGTPALLAAAERYDASADAAPPSVVDAVAVLGILAAMVAGGWRVMAIRAGAADAKMLRRYNGRLPRTRTDVAGQKPAGAVVQDRNGRGGQDQGLTVVQDRNGALLGALRERRQGVGTGTSIPV